MGQTEIFQDSDGFAKLGHFDKSFPTNTRKILGETFRVLIFLKLNFECKI